MKWRTRFFRQWRWKQAREGRKTAANAALMLRRAAKATSRTLALCRMTADELRLSAHELETQLNPHESENPQ